MENRSKYNIFRIEEPKKEVFEYKSFSDFIDEKIRICRKEYYDNETRKFNRRVIANIIGINESELTKIINGSQPTRKRDLIIALCFVLRLSVSETNQALALYTMAALNEDNQRDLLISQKRKADLSIHDLNVELSKAGFSKLNVLREKNRKKYNKDKEFLSVKFTEFEVLSENVELSCVSGEYDFFTLHSRFRPDIYDFSVERIIKRREGKEEKYRIMDDYIGTQVIEIEGVDGWEVIYKKHPLLPLFDEVEKIDLSSFYIEFAKLSEVKDSKKKYIYLMCNDTRNYESRFSALNKDGIFTIYGERFGFDYPEYCEYFQVEMSNDKSTYTITTVSNFMEKYLDKDEWEKISGGKKAKILYSFTSLEEITNSRWKVAFQKLLEAAVEFTNKIKNRELFIFNARVVWDIDELLHIYKVEDEFECISPENMPYDIIPQREWIVGKDGEKVSLDDLYRAAELGICSVDELCSIRKRCGSLENFLHIKYLDEV